QGQAGAAHASHAEMPRSIPELQPLTPADLAASVDGRLPLTKSTVEPPAAAGLGEAGRAPRPVKVDREGNALPKAPKAAKPPPPMMVGTLSMYMEPPRILDVSMDTDEI